MKAEELMIGDIIQAVVFTTDDDDNEVTYKVPARVEAIDENGMLGIDGKDSVLVEYLVKNEMDCYETFDDIEPIPLTFEILKSNGFEYFDSGEGDDWKGYVKRSDKEGFYSVRILANKNEGFRCIILVEGRTDKREKLYVTVYYVHQLQHLLRVCGLSDMADKLKIE